MIFPKIFQKKIKNSNGSPLDFFTKMHFSIKINNQCKKKSAGMKWIDLELSNQAHIHCTNEIIILESSKWPNALFCAHSEAWKCFHDPDSEKGDMCIET